MLSVILENNSFYQNVSFVLDAKVINRVVAIRTKIGYTSNIETKNPAIFTDGRVNFYIIRKCKTIIFSWKYLKKKIRKTHFFPNGYPIVIGMYSDIALQVAVTLQVSTLF